MRARSRACRRRSPRSVRAWPRRRDGDRCSRDVGAADAHAVRTPRLCHGRQPGSGLAVGRARRSRVLWVYALCGADAGLAGVLVASRLNAGYPQRRRVLRARRHRRRGRRAARACSAAADRSGARSPAPSSSASSTTASTCFTSALRPIDRQRRRCCSPPRRSTGGACRRHDVFHSIPKRMLVASLAGARFRADVIALQPKACR